MRKAMKGRIKRNPKTALIEWGLITLFIMIAFSSLITWAEGIDTGEGIWQAWQTFSTVGYGNRPAETMMGRWITMLFGTLGLVAFGAVINKMMDLKNRISNLRRRGMMDNPHEDGYIIFNNPGSERLRRFIDELRRKEPDVPICLVDDKMNELPAEVDMLEAVHFVKGNLISRDTYDKLNINDNKAAVVFPDDPNRASTDSKTENIVEALSRYADEGSDFRVMYSLVDPENQWLFDNINSIETRPVREGLELTVIVQECQDPYSSQIVDDLYSNKSGTGTPETISAKPFAGRTWGEFVRACTLIDGQFNPFALVQGDETDTCPPNDVTIKDDDHISMIAHNGDLKDDEFAADIKQALKQLEELEQNVRGVKT